MKRFLRTSAVALMALAAASGLAAPAHAGEKTVQVNWTGIGIYPQKEPRFHSGTVGAALADGTNVTMVCETYGETVSNNKESSNVWALIKGGGYLPNAFLNTGVNGRTPGVDECGKPPAAPLSAPTLHFKKDYGNGVVVGAKYRNDNGHRVISPNTTTTIAPFPDDILGYDLTSPLLDHWYSGKGGTVLVPWDYFASNGGFMEWLRKTPIGLYTPQKTGEVPYTPGINTDMMYAVGSVLVFQLMEGCYLVTDSYEFDPDKIQNWPYYGLYFAEQKGWLGERFGVASTNC